MSYHLHAGWLDQWIASRGNIAPDVPSIRSSIDTVAVHGVGNHPVAGIHHNVRNVVGSLNFLIRHVLLTRLANPNVTVEASNVSDILLSHAVKVTTVGDRTEAGTQSTFLSFEIPYDIVLPHLHDCVTAIRTLVKIVQTDHHQFRIHSIQFEGDQCVGCEVRVPKSN